MSVESRAFQRWLRSVIVEWRHQAEESPPEHGGQLYRFDEPCQVDVIWAYHALHRLDYRICLVSHFADLPDLGIQIWGPHLPYDIPIELEKFRELPKWQRELPARDSDEQVLALFRDKTYADALKIGLSNAYSGLQTYLSNTVRSSGIDGREMGSLAVGPDCFIFGIGGPIESKHSNTAQYVREHLLTVGRRRAAAKNLSTEQAPVRRPGTGAFWLPPIWVGSAQTASFAETLQRVSPVLTAHQVAAWNREYLGRELTITQSGFCAWENEDRDQTAEALNLLFASGLFHGTPALNVSPVDLFHFSDIRSPLTSFGFEGSVAVDQQLRIHDERLMGTGSDPAPVVEIGTLERVTSFAESSASNKQVALVSRLCLDASSQLHRRDHGAAFLSAWTAIELASARIWKTYLETKLARAADVERISNWEMKPILDSIGLNQLMEIVLIEEADWARKKRNKVIHEAERVAESESRRAIAAAYHTTAAAWGLPDGSQVLSEL